MIYNTELYHHGIKGQKWGVRRFQNEDGSLTSAGEKRYNKEDVANARLKYEKAKQAYKSANKHYNKSFNDSLKYDRRHPIGIHIRKNEKRDNAIELEKKLVKSAYYSDNKRKAMKQAKKEYKDVKKAYRAENPVMSDRAKKNIKRGAIVAGTALAGYGAYKLASKQVIGIGTSKKVKYITQNHYYDPIDITKKFNKIN